MTTDIVEPLELQQPIPGTRRRGRPPRIDPATGEPPKLSQSPAAIRARKARARARTKPTRRAGPRSLRAELVGFLSLVNSLVLMTPLGTRPIAALTDPTIEPERVGDELDTAEIDALASAIDAQCQRSPRVRRVVERFLAAGAGGQLVGIVGIIVTRRAARHGALPAIVDPMLGAMLAGGDLSAALSFVPTPEPDRAPDIETGETPPATIDFDHLDGE